MIDAPPEIDTELRFRRILSENGLTVSDEQLTVIRQFIEYLFEWNSKVNLISRKDLRSVWEAHVLHSVSMLFFLRIHEGASILDLGTGGGFPGIPLAILRSDAHLTLIDSIRKKVDALEDIVGHLPIGNVRIMCGRAEALGRSLPVDNQVDIIVARAVAQASDLVKWSRGWYGRHAGKRMSVRVSTTTRTLTTPLMILLKGGDLRAELARIPSRQLREKPLVLPLVFKGSDTIGMEDKKLVILSL